MNRRICVSDFNGRKTLAQDFAPTFVGYGFVDKLDVCKTEFVDEILNSEGAFVSRRRVGYLIVAPERNLVVFAHAG